MATITLYKNKVNGVGSFIDDIIKSSNNLDTQLGTLKNTLQGVDSSTCNLQAAVDSISSSSKSEKEKVEDLKKLNNKLSEFIETTSKKEAAVKNEIERSKNDSKNDFYKKYYYLKPECEKSGWEKFCDAVGKVCDWCAEHWKIIAAVALIIASIVVIVVTWGAATGPVVGLLVAIAKGCLIGAAIGGAMGGLAGYAQNGVKGILPGIIGGVTNGAIMGAVMGAIGGAGAIAGAHFGCSAFMTGLYSVSSKISFGMLGFDCLALLNDFQARFKKDTGINLGLIDPTVGGFISDLNHKAHSSALYNGLQFAIGATAVFSKGYVASASCFIAGTLVLTERGLVKIEEVDLNDKVLAQDPETNRISFKSVIETFKRDVDRLIWLTVNGEIIKSSFDHPFYVKNVGFIRASDLWIGAELINEEGNTFSLEDIYREYFEEETISVYNFKVADYHTYFVGLNHLLVHNNNCAKIIEDVESGKTELENTKQKGNYGEMKMDQTVETDGYDRISTNTVDSLDASGHKGIDGVYHKEGGTPEYIIGEAKYGTSQLGNTKSGPQMSNNWIADRLEAAVGDSELANKILTEMITNPDNVATNLYHVSPSGEVTVTPLSNGVKVP